MLATGCALTGETDFDPGEDLEVVLVPIGKIRTLVSSGEIRHGVALNAIFRWLDHIDAIDWPE